MATPKSTEERIKRKIRVKGPDTPHNDHNMSGRVVVKKTGNNDPRRNKMKRRIKEAIGNFYLGKSEILKEDVETVLPIIEKLIKCAMHFEGKFPFKIARLTEMRDALKNVVSESVNSADECSITVKISARDKTNVEGVWEVLNTMSYLGQVGASRTLEVFVDGDGAGRFKVEVVSKQGELTEPAKPAENALDSKDGLKFGIGV